MLPEIPSQSVLYGVPLGNLGVGLVFTTYVTAIGAAALWVYRDASAADDEWAGSEATARSPASASVRFRG